MKFSDLFIALFIIGIILLIIIPVNLGLLDMFLALNIAFSLLILLTAIFVKETLDFAVFPTILLFSTMFRLALNISTTRKILGAFTGNLEDKAGDVIKSFANWVVGGDPIVGFIIFIIIVIINFLVITKGAERVSEVAARFTLDAMPGKQMAIDADLNSGLIDEDTARKRRLKIQMEADFYGSMDGASKFVKGDAIAGILITIINIAAGFIIGVTRDGNTLAFALQAYTLLTIGDGLVSQVPALMISTATGIVVTRHASEEDLGQDIINQLLKQQRVLMILGGVLFLLGLATPLPAFPLMTLGILFGFMAFQLRDKPGETLERGEEGPSEDKMDEIRKPESIIPLLQVDPIELEFGYGIIPLADPNQGGDLFDRLVMIRRQIALELGVVIPMIRLRDFIQLDANEYIVKIKGSKVGGGSIMFDHFLAMNPGNVEGEIKGIETVEPAFGLPALWIDEKEREKAEIYGYTVVDPSSIISTHLTEILKRHVHELLGRDEVKSLIDNLRDSSPTVVDELIPGLMSIGDIQKVLCNLLREGISIRNLLTILETLADHAYSMKDVNILTEYARQSLSRYITSTYIGSNHVRVVTLEQSLEAILMESIQQTDGGSYMSLPPDVNQRLLNSLAVEIQNLLSLGEQPIVVTAPIVRFYFKRLTEQMIPDLIVLSYNEIEPDVQIQSAGMVRI
ncbi:MAG: flagellar biosynthesis protein FlhA [Clostridia bacterium]|nr:flagellar biosynthesis protein FlhA [Clostridia bacterium]